MKLQELINQTELDMTTFQVKAFFLGVITAEKPLSFPKAVDELLSQTPEARPTLESDLKLLWEGLQSQKKNELTNLLGEHSFLLENLQTAKDQLDFYLTALSLSGTNTETCKDEDKADALDELEEIVLELDDFLADDNHETSAGEELHQHMMDVWNDYLQFFK